MQVILEIIYKYIMMFNFVYTMTRVVLLLSCETWIKWISIVILYYCCCYMLIVVIYCIVIQ